MDTRKPAGNMLAMIAVFIGVFVILIAFFVLNYTQLLGTHKQAQTAIDAAALQAAKDLGRVVITGEDGCHFGVVGLVDGAPKNNDVNNRGQIGINTILATIRLDGLIAKELGNQTMAVLVAHDLELAKKDSLVLKAKIQGALEGNKVEDVNGNQFNIKDNAATVYDANAVRLGKGQRIGDIDIKLGYVNSPQVFSNVPVPSPNQLAQVNAGTTIVRNNKTYYRSYTQINTDVFGNQLTFGFVASADEPSLLSQNEFSPTLSAPKLFY